MVFFISMQIGCFYGGIVYVIKVFSFTRGPKQRVKKQLSLDQYVKDSVSCFVLFISLSPLSFENYCNSLCIVKVPGLEPKSISDFLRRFCNILLAWKPLLVPKMAAATSVVKLSGRMLKEISASQTTRKKKSENSPTGVNRCSTTELQETCGCKQNLPGKRLTLRDLDCYLFKFHYNLRARIKKKKSGFEVAYL